MPSASAPTYAAIDFGASSGRVLAGRLVDGVVTLTEAARFVNRPVDLPDGRHWDLLGLYAQALEGLHAAGPLAGVGVDTWAVDYGLLDRDGRLLGLPYHYRDARTDGMVERSFARVSREDQYAVAGIQTMPINTVFQLEAERGSAALEAAERIALIPDLLAHWLGGELVNEATNASSTGLLDARTGRWSHALIERLGLPADLFGPTVEAGTTIGRLRPGLGLGDAAVHAVGSHDTASAFAAAPVTGEGGASTSAILSSGTWSLLGLELDAPVLTAAAREANLTNERGVDGTIRLLKNVMGLWLEQELSRTWHLHAAELQRLAAEADPDVPVLDIDDPAFLAPQDLPALIADRCRRTDQRPPATKGETVRTVFVSLAARYRWVLEQLEAVSGREIRTIHVVGGGVRNQLLCRLTADVTGRTVLAGPVEGTGMGNVLMQLRAAGELGSLSELRQLAAASADPRVYEPAPDRAAADQLYRRFLAVAGLDAAATPA
ncbi:rhamnulokinase family protein [Patulibacter sp. SYSU D01012]|uniref:rhamnulokinase n=1 Tax=Patulibacter sp. SYSU D01012 TaxID=2817381 RepID=UPI001B318803|nr:rhamnulokinase family protein [Patulibacter sp. SYSU D01012]